MGQQAVMRPVRHHYCGHLLILWLPHLELIINADNDDRLDVVHYYGKFLAHCLYI